MDTEVDKPGKTARISVLAAWGSPLVGAVISVILWQWLVNHLGTRGERPPGVLLFYLVLLFVSVAGALAGLASLWGIRSRRDALIIIPGALLGICLNICNAFFAFLSHALEGVNLGG